ncbi:MAG: hypothetical protein IJC32_06215 [Clostridia bacterium]|nr:hypothetical protein [Clostridia bacterium]
MKKLFFTLCLLALTLATLAACGDKTGDTDGVIKVKYNSETGKVSVSATLTSDTYKKYKNETLYLMEIPAGQSIRDVATSVPAAQLKAKGTMEQSLELKSGARTLLYSGFVLAYYNYAEGYTPIGEVRYVENPEALATSKQKYPDYASPKGLFVTSAAQAVKTGTKHTVIRVPVEKFIRAKGDEETLATIFCGNSYYISRAEIAKLDHKIKTMSESGIEVLLQFTLDTDPYALDEGVGKLASLYTRGGSAPEGENKHYALAVTDPDGFEKLASFFEYIAQRYTQQDGEYGFAGAFIIGDSVNDLESANTDVERTLAETTERYSTIFRIAYTALRSNYANGKIFVPVDSEWSYETAPETDTTPPDTASDTTDETASDPEGGQTPSTPMPVARKRRFGAKEFLSNFAAKITLGGDIPYSVCLTLLHDGDSDVKNDISQGGKTPTKINCGNLTAVNTFLNSAGLTYGDDRRELAVIASIPAQDEKKMAQSYAELYFACTDNAVSAFIYNGERDNATGNGETGLMTAQAEGQKGEKRKIYDIFCAIDRTNCAETLSKLSDSLGSRAEKYAEEKKLAFHAVTDGSSTEIKVKRGESAALYTFDGTSVADFYPAYSAVSLSPRDENGGAIEAVLSPLGPGDLMGVRSPEISGERLQRGKVIKVTLNATLPTSNTGKLTLLLQSTGKNIASCESTVTAQSGNRQTVWFDISEFADKIDEKDTLRLSLLCEADNSAPLRGDETADTGYSLTIYGIELVTKKPISPLWWIIPIILVILGGLFFLYVRFRPSIEEAISNYRENTARQKAAERRRSQGAQRPQRRGNAPRPPQGYRAPRPQGRPRPQNPAPYGRPNPQRPSQDPRRNGY